MRLYAVLVNPRVHVSTPEVFKALKTKGNPPMPDVIPPFAGAHDCIDWLADQRNDLQEAACALRPEIAETLAVIEADAGCLLARMSGSGATCFGLYGSKDAAIAGAQRIAGQRPDWWVAGVELGSMGQAAMPRFSSAD